MTSTTKQSAPDVRVALLEDDPAIRAHLEQSIASKPGLVLVASAARAADAGALVAARPDVALVDLGLPDGSGVDVIARLNKETSAKVIVITIFRDRDSVLGALAAGADGYLLKDSTPEQMFAAVEAALGGGAPISPDAARHLLAQLDAQRRDKRERVDQAPILSAREVELLNLFARGLSYREAARVLEISPHTVGDHVKSVYRKLNVNSRSEAVFEATQAGLITPHT